MKTMMPPRYGRISSWLLIGYLSVMVSGCALRPAEISPEAAKALQTRDLNHNKDDVARAVVSVLQEMHYTLGTVDMDLGLISAQRNSERSLAPISREVDPETGMTDEMQTFCLVAGAIAVVAILFSWIWDDDDDNDREHTSGWHRRPYYRHPHHDHSSVVFVGTDEYGPDYYNYNMTVSLEALSPYTSRIRVSVQGQYIEGSLVSQSGPVQDAAFYDDFYNRLQRALDQ